MRKLFIATVFILASFGIAAAQPAVAPAAKNAGGSVDAKTAAAELSLTDAIILGIVEGVTEFLPISSTGHLIITTRLLHLDSEQPLVDANGQPLYHKKPSAKRPLGEPLTLKLAADTFTVVIQFGAIAAVALLYWSQFMAMLRGLLGQDPAGLRLLINLIIAFLPAAAIGFLAHDWIDAHLFSVGAVIAAQVAGAFLMFYAEAWRHRNAARFASTSPPLHTDQKPEEVTTSMATTIGFLQCFAMWPGTSRSMMTIVGGYFVGLEPKRAAEFSFLLGFVTLTAASVYKSYKSGAAMIAVFGWPHVLVGMVVAAITAAICVKFLVRWLTRHGLGLFAWYRIAVAIVLAVAFYLWK